jgi:hypothetical protein
MESLSVLDGWMKERNGDNDLTVLLYIKVFTVRIDYDLGEEFLNDYTPIIFNSIANSSFVIDGTKLPFN